MTPTEIAVAVSGGVMAGLDFGGRGRSVLFVHGSGHNAAVWTDVAAALAGRCHAVGIDLRGHGQTPLGSSDPEQYWHDIGDVVQALGWRDSVLVGHSTGGYAVTAATAARLLAPSAICVVDGLVLDDRAEALAQHAALRSPEAVDRLRGIFRYGWHADEEQMEAYVDQCLRAASSDWLNAGARPGLVELVTRRSFLAQGREWVRRPTLEEIAIVADVQSDADVFPSRDVYRRITCPMIVVLPNGGFYAERRDEVQDVVAADPRRRLVEVESNHNVPMTHPGEVAAALLDILGDLDQDRRPPAEEPAGP